jgi:hypothetical protein
MTERALGSQIRSQTISLSMEKMKSVRALSIPVRLAAAGPRFTG